MRSCCFGFSPCSAALTRPVTPGHSVFTGLAAGFLRATLPVPFSGSSPVLRVKSRPMQATLAKADAGPIVTHAVSG